MRIEQPKHLKPLWAESFRLDTRLGLRGLTFVCILPSAIALGVLADRAADGEAIARWQWLAGVAGGPFCMAMIKSAFWLHGNLDRYAEIRGGRVHLGILGYTFRPSQLLYCKIEPDSHFPEISCLCFCFRLFPFGRPRYWALMVENLSEAAEFQHLLMQHAHA
jgi:hypothetical protein